MSKFKVENYTPRPRYVIIEPIEIKDIFDIKKEQGGTSIIMPASIARTFVDYLQHPTRARVHAVGAGIENLYKDDIITYKDGIGEPMMINGVVMTLIPDSSVTSVVKEDKKEMFDMDLNDRTKMSAEIKEQINKNKNKPNIIH